MKNTTLEILEKMLEQYPELRVCRVDIEKAFNLLRDCYLMKGKVLICGNGGSAADAEHIVGELMKGFMLKRNIKDSDIEKLMFNFPEEGEYLSKHLQSALPAISLVSQSAISTAFINDISADMVYAQQVYGYGNKGDVLIGISTSGNAGNVINALKVSRTFELKTIGLTGENGGGMNNLCDVVIRAPHKETYRVQEYHLPIYHALCAMIENEFFN